MGHFSIGVNMHKRDKLLGKFIQDYYAERFNSHFFVTEAGFYQYRIENNVFYVDEFYIDPTFRNFEIPVAICNELKAYAKRQGCNLIIGWINYSTKHASSIERLLIHMGMTPIDGYENKESRPFKLNI